MPQKPEMESKVYTIPEVAALLGINVAKAYELARQPGFPCIKIGRRLITPKAAFERWLEQAALDKQSYDTTGVQQR